MKIHAARESAFATFAVLVALLAPPLAAAPVPGDGSVKPRLELQDVKVGASRAGSVTLELAWTYVEQDNLVRPKELSIIAVLIGVRGKEYRGTRKVPVPKTGPLPTSARVVINHEEQLSGPPLRAKVTLTGITDGTSNTIAPVTRELEVRLAP
jgi:hypothetical protein